METQWLCLMPRSHSPAIAVILKIKCFETAGLLRALFVRDSQWPTNIYCPSGHMSSNLIRGVYTSKSFAELS